MVGRGRTRDCTCPQTGGRRHRPSRRNGATEKAPPALNRHNSSIHEAPFGYRSNVLVSGPRQSCAMTIALLALSRPSLAAEATPVVGASLCPAPDTIWQEL